MGPGDIVIPGTNLGTERTATTYTLTSSTGNSTTLETATGTLAGLLSPTDKAKLDTAPSCVAVSLTATQDNNTVTEAILNRFTFTIPPGKSATINVIMIFKSATTRTGGFLGIRVSQGAGANGNAVGSWNAHVNLSASSTSTGLSNGDVINIAAGATSATGTGVLGTATTSGNVTSRLLALLSNTSTNADTTVSIVFRSEVNNNAVTAQIGTTATCIIG